ncbi:MAG: hypothetical protein Q9172_004374 [Xanthocarpia lactea]
MRLPSLLTVFILIQASVPLNLRLPVSSSPNTPGSISTITEPRRNWPKVPWKFTGLLNGGTVWFEEYGRGLSFNSETRRQVHESSGRIAQALRLGFHPESQPLQSWTFVRGVVNFSITLDPKTPATRAEVLDLFDWILALMRRFIYAPKEINRALLLDAHESWKAEFSLTFPSINGGRPDESGLASLTYPANTGGFLGRRF